MVLIVFVYDLLLYGVFVVLVQFQEGERTSQSRDQNIEKEYKLGNFVGMLQH